MPFKTTSRARLDANDATAQEQLGALFHDATNGKVYKYVLAEDANLANGDVVEFSDTSGYEVTKDRSGGSSIGRAPAGVAIGTITDGQYGWIQVYGKHSAVKVGANVAIAAADALVPHATIDGSAFTAVSSSTAVNTEAQRFGFALGADTATTSVAGVVVAEIRCM